jgi:xanthosine utilization system XapX-like protein
MQGLGRYAGLIVGLVFGAIWVRDSFADAVLVAVVGLIGYYVGAVLSGDIDIVEMLARRNR